MEIWKKIIGYFREMLKGDKKKKTLENTVIVIIIGIILLIAGGTLLERKDNNNTAQSPDKGKSNANMSAGFKETDGKTEFERELEQILSRIEGVGKVEVMVTYVSGEEIVPAYDVSRKENKTQEKDSDGGTRNIDESDYQSKVAYIEESGGEKKPIVIKSNHPVVRGAIVVAEGAGNLTVKENIIMAVQALTDIPIHKIQVFEMKR